MSRTALVFAGFVAFASVLGSVGCSSDADDASNGSAPVVKNLVITPTTIGVGKQSILDGSLTVDDADGDLAALHGDLAAADGQKVSLKDNDLTQAGAQTSAPVTLKLTFQVPAAGDYTLSFWATDKAGNTSAKVTQVLTAQ